VAQAAAAIHGVSPLLADALRWPGPPAWRQFLTEQKAHTAARFSRIQQLLQQLDIRAREAGVALMPLKGAALHAIGLYAAGERPMADVDLLVRDDQSRRTTQILGTLRLHETHRNWKHRVFEQAGHQASAALGEHTGNDIKVELHCRIGEALPLRAVDVTEIVFPQSPHPGLNAYPSKAALLIHLLLHAAGAMIGRQLRLLQLHDIARLSGRMTQEDWEDVLRRAACTADGGLWWAYPPLALAARYYGCVPDRVLARAASGCHWLLQRVYRNRTLTGASLSHLWVSAFPGIEWARSTRAMLEYAAARVLPSAETVRMRRTLATVQPRVAGGPWTQLSQGQRMLRWLTSPQARYETLQPVRAALRDAP
jgi:putative nucleotidyltransferase-like protein